VYSGGHRPAVPVEGVGSDFCRVNVRPERVRRYHQWVLADRDAFGLNRRRLAREGACLVAAVRHGAVGRLRRPPPAPPDDVVVVILRTPKRGATWSRIFNTAGDAFRVPPGRPGEGVTPWPSGWRRRPTHPPSSCTSPERAAARSDRHPGLEYASRRCRGRQGVSPRWLTARSLVGSVVRARNPLARCSPSGAASGPDGTTCPPPPGGATRFGGGQPVGERCRCSATHGSRGGPWCGTAGRSPSRARDLSWRPGAPSARDPGPDGSGTAVRAPAHQSKRAEHCNAGQGPHRVPSDSPQEVGHRRSSLLRSSVGEAPERIMLPCWPWRSSPLVLNGVPVPRWGGGGGGGRDHHLRLYGRCGSRGRVPSLRAVQSLLFVSTPAGRANPAGGAAGTRERSRPLNLRRRAPLQRGGHPSAIFNPRAVYDRRQTCIHGDWW